jgi:hypothetical protein
MNVPANAEGAASADAALKAYMSRTRSDCDDCLADLLCDLMHCADTCGLSFAEAFRLAYFHYRAEVADKEAAE